MNTRQSGIALRGLLTLAAALILAVAASSLAVTRWRNDAQVRTDNAYVAGHLIQVTPQVAGTVIAVNAHETERVTAGFPLVELDPADAEVALQRTEADLLDTIRQTAGLIERERMLVGRIEQREAALLRARAYAERRDPLNARGAVSAEEAADARLALAAAEAAVEEAQGELAAHRALIGGSTVESHPAVRAAAARVADAFLALERTVIRSPVEGTVARRAVEIGSRVAEGNRLMALVPLDDLWVEANFKENQLANIRVGQPAELIVDAYGREVVYRGRVAGFSPGTGSSLALLPAQNATGNWIKIVQRVPVRVAIEPDQLGRYPLLIGLSVRVTVDTADRGGAALTTAPATASPRPAADDLVARANAYVADIIARASGS